MERNNLECEKYLYFVCKIIDRLRYSKLIEFQPEIPQEKMADYKLRMQKWKFPGFGTKKNVASASTEIVTMA